MTNDRFKFRVWDKQEKVMIYDIAVCDQSFFLRTDKLPNGYAERLPDASMRHGDAIIEVLSSDRFVIMQYVDGNEMREHDLIDGNGRELVISRSIFWEVVLR